MMKKAINQDERHDTMDIAQMILLGTKFRIHIRIPDNIYIIPSASSGLDNRTVTFVVSSNYT